MSAYEFEDGKVPEYLQAEYGLPEMEGINIQKLIRDDLEFVDSKSLDGVQAVDLLASGLRRLLRAQFRDNVGIARAFSSLFLQNKRDAKAISLITMSPEETFAPRHVANVVKAIDAGCKRLLVRTSEDAD